MKQEPSMKINKNTTIERIQNYLYSFYAKDLNTAREREIYDCLCRYIMERVGKTWVSSKKIKEGYEVYILSFEYLLLAFCFLSFLSHNTNKACYINTLNYNAKLL